MRDGSEHQEQAKPWQIFSRVLASVFIHYWGVILTFVIAGFAASVGFLILLGQQKEHAQQRQNTTAHYSATESQKRETECTWIGFGRFKCTVNGDETGGADAATKYDLKAQQDMSEWAFGMLVVSIIGTIITASGVIFVALTLAESRNATRAADLASMEAKKANDLNAKIFEVSQRPWLGFQITETRPIVVSESHGIGFPIEFTISNYGDGPAHAVGAATFGWPFGGPVVNFEPDRGNDTIENIQEFHINANCGSVVFPNHSVKKNISIHIKRAEWIKLFEDMPGSIRGVNVFVRMRVFYKQSAISTDVLYTDNLFILTMANGSEFTKDMTRFAGCAFKATESVSETAI